MVIDCYSHSLSYKNHNSLVGPGFKKNYIKQLTNYIPKSQMFNFRKTIFSTVAESPAAIKKS